MFNSSGRGWGYAAPSQVEARRLAKETAAKAEPKPMPKQKRIIDEPDLTFKKDD